MEGKFCHGRTHTLCDPAQGRGSMASLCREFGISRKTGYKIFERYEECGLEGLTDRARRPHRYANQLPEQIEAAIVRPSARSRTGVPARSANACCGAAERSEGSGWQHHSCGPRSPWLGDAAKRSRTRPKARRCPRASARMSCGAPITRASSCSAISATATR